MHRPCFPFSVVALVALSLPMEAREPALEPSRSSTYSKDQNQWLTVRQSLFDRSMKLTETDAVAARRSLQTIVDGDKEKFGENHEETARGLYHVAEVLYRLRDFDKAFELRVREFEIYRKVFGVDNWRLSAARDRLEVWDRITGEGLETVRTKYGEAWKNTEEARRLKAAGKYAEALSRFLLASEALAQVGAALKIGVDKNYDLASCMTEMADVLVALDRYNEAESMARKAMQFFARRYGIEHPAYADALALLGAAYLRRADSVRAEDAFREVISIYEKAFGYPHRSTVHALQQLARIYIDSGRHALAEETCLKALKVLEGTDGAYPQTKVDILRSLTSALSGSGRTDEAMARSREAIKLAKDRFGEIGEFSIQTLYDHAHVLAAAKKDKEALEHAEAAFALQLRHYPGQSFNVSVMGTGVGLLRRKSGKYAEGEQILREMLPRLRKSHGDGNLYTDKCLGALCDLYADWRDQNIRDGKVEAAREIAKRLLDLRTATIRPGSWGLSDSRLRLADLDRLLAMNPNQRAALLAAQQKFLQAKRVQIDGKLKEALPLMEQVLEAQADWPAGSLAPVETKLNLGYLHHALGDAGKAEPFDKQAIDEMIKLYGDGRLPPHLIVAYIRTGQQEQARDNLGRAIAHFEHARDTFARYFNKRHVDHLTAFKHSIIARREYGDLRHVEADSRELVDLCSKVYGNNHPKTREALDELVTILSTTNQFDAAEKIAIEQAEASKPTSGPPSKEHLEAKNTIGTMLLRAGKLDEAAAIFEQITKDYKTHHGEEAYAYTVYLTHLGMVEAARGRLDEAEGHLHNATTLLHKLKSSYSRAIPALLSVQQTIAFKRLSAGEYEGAVSLLDGIATWKKQVDGDKHHSTVLAAAWASEFKTLTQLPEAKRKPAVTAVTSIPALERQCQRGQSGELLKSARFQIQALHEALANKESESLSSAFLLKLLAHGQSGEGECAVALNSLERASAILAKLLGPEHPETARTTMAMARIRLAMGDFAKARDEFGSAAANLEKGDLPALVDRTEAIAGKAQALLRMGDFTSARAALSDVEVNSFNLQVDYPAQRAAVLFAHMEFAIATGDVAQARTLLDTTERLVATRLSNQPSARARLLTFQTALAARDRRDELSRQAMESSAAAFGNHSLERAAALDVICTVKTAAGKFDEAAKAQADAAEIRKRSTGRFLPADELSAARIAAAKGDAAKAEKHARAALDLLRTARLPDWEAVQILADASHQLGRFDDAQKFCLEALTASKATADGLAPIQSESAHIRFVSDRREALDRLLSLPITPARSEAAYRQWLAWKGSGSTRARLLQSARTNVKLSDFLARHDRLAVTLSTAAARIPYREERAYWQARVQALTEEFNRLEDEILAEAKVALPGRSTLEQLRASIPEKTALFDFVEYDHFFPAEAGRPAERQRRLAGFLTRAGQPVIRIDYGDALSIESLILEWRKKAEEHTDLTLDLAKGNLAPEAERAARFKIEDFEKLMTDVSERLWRPLGDKLAGIERIWVSPDGEVGRFPFQTLLVSKDQYVVEKYIVTIVPIPGLPASQRANRPVELNGVTAITMGGVEFDSAPEKTFERKPIAVGGKDFLGANILGRSSWRPLAASGPEAQAVAALLGKQLPSRGVSLRLGPAATENEFRTLAGQNRWHHFATHGFYIKDVVIQRDDRIGTGELHRSVPGKETPPPILYHPGLFSGITLAGANEPNDYDQDDGILWSFEVANSDLRHVDLAVLSACDTANGFVIPGEGVLGLQRAYHLAGAKTVLATYWPVFDTGARLMMDRFFINIVQNRMAPDAALREVQVWMLTAARKKARGETDPNFPDVPIAYGTPYSWSPFFLDVE